MMLPQPSERGYLGVLEADWTVDPIHTGGAHDASPAI